MRKSIYAGTLAYGLFTLRQVLWAIENVLELSMRRHSLFRVTVPLVKG